jgi:hypothetical protein
MTHEELLAELDRRRAEARRMGGAKKLEARKNSGDLNAEERLAALVDAGSFVELGLLGASGVYEDDAPNTPRDGKITGFGLIDGRDVGVVVNDFTTKGASTSATNSKKMGYIRKACTEKGMRQRRLPIPADARYAVGRGGAQHLLRFVGMAVLLRGFRGYEEGLDHVGLQPAAGLHGDRRKGRSRGVGRLAAPRREHRVDRAVR